MKLKNIDVSTNHNKKLFLCHLDAKWIARWRKKKNTTKEKHNLDNKIKWKLKEQRIKNTKLKQRNKKNKKKSNM